MQFAKERRRNGIYFFRPRPSSGGEKNVPISPVFVSGVSRSRRFRHPVFSRSFFGLFSAIRIRCWHSDDIQTCSQSARMLFDILLDAGSYYLVFCWSKHSTISSLSALCPSRNLEHYVRLDFFRNELTREKSFSSLFLLHFHYWPGHYNVHCTLTMQLGYHGYRWRQHYWNYWPQVFVKSIC